MELIFGYLFIFFARVSDVSLATIRTLMVVQGRRWQAALIGFFEVSIYVTALSKVVGNLDNPLNLLSYALGFACGNYLGITIENKIALGNLATQIILNKPDNKELLQILRQNGFGVTVVIGQGLEGSKEIFNVAINRKDLPNLKKIVYEYDKNAFITVNNINPISGGYFATNKK
ncbi:DUF2179 domain-containing protein [Tissierella praeacuta]|uniref:DUF2179 domain-containing protein n=1 Tax=Tissierella praeacuta TaxID=43131 RepID=UPI000ECD5994|nr:DUF5698 domain-containing protein [Tissierella praeacuta]MBU5256133.1 DUF2179 domain-containing protein [Tissierella praeacuta]HAE92268.1 DUF2179 domain-containing protein [Tissierella sp.]